LTVTEAAQRIVSLLPSATEIVYALGLGDRLVGVTHECDYPPEASEKPKVTSSVIDSEGMSAGQIDAAVRDSLANQETIYYLDDARLADLQPDLLLTQELCDVCAVGPPLVQQAIVSLEPPPRVASLEPRTLAEVMDSIVSVGRLTGVEGRAQDLVDRLNDRLNRVRQGIMGRDRVPVLTLEWVDPVFVGGHWVPEQVWIAGGLDVLGKQGEPSRQVDWSDVVESDPDVVVAMPCGFGLDRSAQEMARADLPAAWHDLRAVRNGDVYVVDGSSYFNRPGPRLIDGVEILASILHPDVAPQPPARSYARLSELAPA
jgi:iron complex transport system substrate-binding protein